MRFLLIFLLAISCNAQYLQHSRKAFRSVVSSGGLSKSSLFAWYDFADASDSHGIYTLDETNSPAYTAGSPNFGTSLAAGTNCWRQTTIDNAYATNNADKTVIIRFRAIYGIVNGSYILSGWNGKLYVRWVTAGISASVHDVVKQTTTVPATNTWYLVVAEYTAADSSIDVWVNNGSINEASGTYSTSALSLLIGRGSHISNTSDFDIDYLGFYNRKLTSDERTWLYNAGGTRTYSELSP